MKEADRQVERMRIRAKLSDDDREFLDAIREVFPSARLVGIRFNDGEEIGKCSTEMTRSKADSAAAR